MIVSGRNKSPTTNSKQIGNSVLYLGPDIFVPRLNQFLHRPVSDDFLYIQTSLKSQLS